MDSAQNRPGGKPSMLQVLNKMVAENQYKATLVSRVACAPMAVKNFGYQPYCYNCRCSYVF